MLKDSAHGCGRQPDGAKHHASRRRDPEEHPEDDGMANFEVASLEAFRQRLSKLW
jgi:hypothetical protein